MKVTQEWIDYQERKKAQYKAEHDQVDKITRFSDREFNQSMKLVQSKGKKGKTPKFSQSRLWNHNNIDSRGTSEIVINGKIYKSIGRRIIK